MRILLFGDGPWAANSLEALLRTGHQVVAVVLRPAPSDSTLEKAALGSNLPIFQPANVNAPEFVEVIKWIEADLGVSIACNQIMRRPLLNCARLGFVNVHAGKLPEYRGRNIINWAIINGESEIGLTAHVLDDGIDTGDILLQRTLPIYWRDNYGDVLNRVVDNVPDFLVEAVQAIESNKIVPQPQRHLSGTYFSGRTEEDEWLDWSEKSLALYNKIRAISRPGPGALTLLGDSEVRVWKATYDPSWPAYVATPGQVVGRCDDGVVVKTGSSTLLLEEVQVGNGISEKPSWRLGTRLGVNLLSLVRSLQTRVQELEQQISASKRS